MEKEKKDSTETLGSLFKESQVNNSFNFHFDRKAHGIYKNDKLIFKNMKKNVFLLIVLLQYGNSLWAQPCSVGLPYVLQFATQDVTHGQSFTPTCSGQLKTINLSFASVAEDLRGTGWSIRCNIKTASNSLIATGIMPNGKDTTNNVYPLQTLNVDFNCSNVMLTAGTKYIWEVVVITQNPILWPIPAPGLVLFSRSNTSLLAGGDYINDGVTVSTQDIRGFNVTIDTPNPTLTATQSQTNPSCGICTDGSASVVASGGTGTYTYSWSPSGGSTATATNLSNGTYTCTITSCGQSIDKTFILSNNATIAQGWTQIGPDFDGVQQNGRFGWSVSMPDSLTVAIGAPNRSQGSDFFTGQVKIYRRTGNTWTQKGADLNGVPFNSSGRSVSMPDSNTIAIGGLSDTVQVFSWNGTAWVQKGLNIVGEAQFDYSGQSVSMPNANTVAIGAVGNNGNGNAAGHTRIYIWDGSSWIQKGSDIDGEAAVDQSGYSVSMPDHNTVAIGANENDGNGNNAGHVRIYRWNGSAWVQKGLDIDGENADDQSGFSVSMPDSNTLAIGAPANGNAGHVRIYSWNGSAWVQKGLDIDGENAGDAFGYSVSMPDGNTVAIGARGNDANGSNAGTTSIYSWNGNSWIKRGINLNGENAGSQFGFFVSMPNSKTVAIGAPFQDLEMGMVRIFDLTCPLIDSTLTITACASYTWPLNGVTYTSSTNIPNVTLMTSEGCDSIINLNLTIVNPTIPLSGSTINSNVSCFGGTNGAIDLTPSGGTSPYTFNWGGGITTEDRTALAIGMYSVIITDAASCKDTFDITITQPTVLTSSVSSQTNVLCNGASTGSATVLAGGGTAPYTYSWSPSGGTAATATGLAAGTYTCTITDANSCTKTQTATITQPTVITSSVSSQTNVSCFGGSNGAATVLAGGGTGTYTYSWSPSGGTAATATGLAAGTYTCTITDANGCTKTQVATITEPTALSATAVITNVSCNGGTNGAIDVSVSGGTTPYTYSWGAGVTTQDRTGLSAGTYLDTVTDANGCQAFASYTITEPSAITSSVSSQTNVLCNGASTGAATISASGGTGAYTYSWSPSGGTASTATGLAAGTYTCTITDANSCTKTQNVTITQLAALTASVNAQTNVSCNGASNGGLSVLASGGTAPLTYSWSPNGGSFAVAVGLAAGMYTCTVTDANGCIKTASATITQPAAGISSSVTSQTNILCFGDSTGKAKIAVSGGTAPYTYSWTGSSSTADSIVSMSAGTYTCTITDANGCTKTQAVTLTEPTAISATAVITNVSCNTGTNGAIDVTVSGGTSPYTYSWGAGITTEDRTNLSAGTYLDTVSDANGCKSYTSYTVTEPTAISSSIASQTNVLCFGNSTGKAKLSVSGGTAPYTYSWTGNASTGDSITGVVAGTYTCTITDANSCTKTQTVTITQPAAALSSSVTSQTNILCNGASTGKAKISVSGGTAPYTYSWTGSSSTADSIVSMAAGTYTCTITDANGCTKTQVATITEPTALSATAVVTNVSCNAGTNGAIDVTVSGGTTPYTYSWEAGVTTQDRTNLSAGIYLDTVSDANGCKSFASYTITEPTAISSSIASQTNVLCNGASTGSATISASGGTGSLTYSWSPSGGTAATATGLAAGTYTCTITDANSCTKTQNVTITQLAAISYTSITTHVSCFAGNNGAINITAAGGTAPYTFNWGGGITTEDRTSLTAGAYNVTITDANACSAAFTLNVTQPTQLSSTIAVTNASCFAASDGALDITVTGGTAPYGYFWISSLTSEDLTSRSAGTYWVAISDANGCTLNDTAVVTQPSEIISSTVVSHVDCFGNSTGAINIVPSGGFGPYTYNWGGGITSEDRTALAAGSYNLTITDATSCTKVITTVVTQPTVLTAANTSLDILCFGASTGSIDLTPAGGTAPYTYNWGGGITSQDLSNIPAGNYNVVVTDAQGCVVNLSETLTQPTNLTFVKDSTNILCFGDNSGIADVTVSGGVAPYSYSWIGTSAFTTTANYLTAGNYSVQITDNNGCVKTAQFALTQNPAITSNFTVAQCDPYTWAANYYPTSGVYQQIFTAANGCDSIVTLNLTVYGYPTISISASEMAVCYGESVTLNATGGVSNATWDNGVTNNQAFVPNSTVTYTATIASAQGCVTTGSIEIFVRELPNVVMENFPDSTCLDANLVACPFATPAGGTYAGPGVSGVLLSTSVAGLGQHDIIYTYTDQHGCSNSDTSTINIVECELPNNQTGLDENTEEVLLIYPNPNNGEFTIESNRNSVITITDAIGKVLKTIELQMGENQISLSNEANGVYFVIFNSNKSIQRIVKQ
jgi:SprB repeat/Secretion system C-terminal sorting domain/FG-GAP repeat